MDQNKMDQKQPSKDDWYKAGEIAANARRYAAAMAKPNVLLLDIANAVEQKIRDDGAVPGFPANLSLNTTAAHYTPHCNDETRLTKEHILKVDIGACFNGAIGDTAVTVDLSGNYEKLVESSAKALQNVCTLLTPETKLGEIGKTIQETIEGFGFKPVFNLSGHGIAAYEIHTAPSFPNYNNHNQQKLHVDQTFAVEPFATDGAGKIKEGTDPNIFEAVENKPIRDNMARQVMAEINKFKGLPFAKRMLVSEKLPLSKVDFGLRLLKQNGNIIAHAPLVEVAGGIVTQAEHTFIVEEDQVVCLTK